MAGPLSGIRILDLTSVLMGPSATQAMADLGAEVIKVESPGGDTTRGVGPGHSPGMGSNFLNMNRGKRSIVIDLKQARGREVLARLIAGADVFIHNVRAQAMARLGLAYQDVREINQRIVYCSLSGFGRDGPYAGKPAYDDLVQGLCALPAMYARCGDIPRYVPTPVVDRVGGLNAVIGVVTALFHRERTGEGQEIEVPMFESMAHLVLSDHLYGRTFHPPLGEAGYTRLLSAQRHPYRTADGWICVLTYTDKHWLAFFDLIGRPELKGDPRYADMRMRNTHIDDLYRLVGEQMTMRTTAQWLEALQGADIPSGPMHSLDSLIEDQHLQAVNFVQTVQHPTEGSIMVLRTPTTWSATPPSPTSPAPLQGEHTEEILREAGFGHTDIQQLLSEKVIGTASLNDR